MVYSIRLTRSPAQSSALTVKQEVNELCGFRNSRELAQRLSGALSSLLEPPRGVVQIGTSLSPMSTQLAYGAERHVVS